MIRRPPRSTLSSSSAASDVYKRQVDVADDRVARNFLQPLSEKRRRTAVRERAARLEVRHDDRLFRREDLRRLGHEVHARECDDLLRNLRPAPRELERVAHEVGEILDLGLLVVVRQDYCVSFLLEAANGGLEIERRVDGHRACDRERAVSYTHLTLPTKR